jgi:peptide/nickel transport system permease protein
MLAYVIRRLLYTIPLVLGVAMIVWLVFDSGILGDPAQKLVGKSASPEELEALRIDLGFRDPPWTRFGRFLGDIAALDFGRSREFKLNVVEMIARGVGPSLALTAPAFLVATLIAIALSLFCAAYRGGFLDRTLVVVAVALMSVSSLVYIIFGQYFLGYHGPFPVAGFAYDARMAWYLALPWVIFVFLTVGPDLRFYRTAVLEEVKQDYVRTAKAKGVHGRKILFVHILRNAMIPILTRIVVVLPFLFTGSLLLEQFFQIPGIGGITVMGVLNDDMPVIRAMTFVFAILFIIGNLLTDILYTVVDPRVRLQ